MLQYKKIKWKILTQKELLDTDVNNTDISIAQAQPSALRTLRRALERCKWRVNKIRARRASGIWLLGPTVRNEFRIFGYICLSHSLYVTGLRERGVYD